MLREQGEHCKLNKIFFVLFLSETLLKKVGLREKSKVIDLTRKGLTVESLTESKLMCSVQDKVRCTSK